MKSHQPKQRLQFLQKQHQQRTKSVPQAIKWWRQWWRRWETRWYPPPRRQMPRGNIWKPLCWERISWNAWKWEYRSLQNERCRNSLAIFCQSSLKGLFKRHVAQWLRWRICKIVITDYLWLNKMPAQANGSGKTNAMKWALDLVVEPLHTTEEAWPVVVWLVMSILDKILRQLLPMNSHWRTLKD